MVSLIYGAVTVLVCVLALAKGSKATSWIGVVTFLGWLYYMLIERTMVFSLEQAFLAVGDVAQALVIFWLIVKARMGFLALAGMCVAFTAMLGLHLSMFFVPNHTALPYHTLLNVAYILQLITLTGMVLRDGRAGIASDSGIGLRRNSHLGGGAS